RCRLGRSRAQRQGRQRAVAESEYRGRRQYHAACQLLFRGRRAVPRLPGQLRPWRHGGLAARRGLPHQSGQLGSQKPKAPQALLNRGIIAGEPRRFGFALRYGHFHPTLSLRWAAGLARTTSGVAWGCVIPMKSWASIARRARATSRAPIGAWQRSCIPTPIRTIRRRRRALPSLTPRTSSSKTRTSARRSIAARSMPRASRVSKGLAAAALIPAPASAATPISKASASVRKVSPAPPGAGAAALR